MKYITTVLLVLSFSATSFAQERPLPAWRECYTNTGERMACYTFEEAQQLLVLEQDFLAAQESVQFWTQQFGDSQRMVRNLEYQIEQLESIRLLLTTRNSDLTDRAMAEIEAKNYWKAEAESPEVWPLLAGGALTLVSVGILIASLIFAL